MSALSADVKKIADQDRRACDTYRQKLHDRMTCMGLAPEGTDRMKTALATQKLVGLVSAAEPANVVALLARAEVATTEAAMGECRSKAAELEGNLETAGWEIFEAIGKLDDERKATAEAILADVRQALAADEHVTALAPALKGTHARAVRLLTKVVPPPQPPVVPPVAPPPAADASGCPSACPRARRLLIAIRSRTCPRRTPVVYCRRWKGRSSRDRPP